ncbi:MAG: hypothetical protein RL721_1326 [Candidatus Eisenbacteria bacterium]
MRVVPSPAPTITVPNAIGEASSDPRAGTRRSTRTGRWSLVACSAVAYAAPSGMVGGSWMLLLWCSPSLPTALYVPATSSSPVLSFHA